MGPPAEAEMEARAEPGTMSPPEAGVVVGPMAGVVVPPDADMVSPSEAGMVTLPEAGVVFRAEAGVVSAPEAGGGITAAGLPEERTQHGRLRVLAVDDEPPALDELAYLLGADARVGSVARANDAADALRVLRGGEVDAVFLDIRMPGPDGLDLARALRRAAVPPTVVFVTAHDDRAVDAYDLGAVDYLLKPLRPERLAESLRRVAAARDAAGPPGPERWDDEVIPVELAGRTTMLSRSEVRWVEAQGDYARLHTADASHLIRVPLSVLAERWADAGFVRIHRSYLVSLRDVRELRLTGSGYVVLTGDRELPVSRRHTRELKDRLVRAAKSAWTRT
jgi:DNA-binding LytR/AlgR family response regulator